MRRRQVSPVAGLSPYELRHVVAHLAAAGRAADVDRLLRLEHGAGNAWFERKRELGAFDDYLADLDAARRLAEAEDDAVGQAEYAVMLASVGAQVSAVPVRGLARAASSGAVDPAQAVVLARHYPDPDERAGALIALVAALDGEPRREAAAAVLETIPQLPAGSARVRALSRLAPDLPPALSPPALALARGDDNLLREVAPGLQRPELDALLAEVVPRQRAALERKGARWWRDEPSEEHGARLGDEDLLRCLLGRLAELGEPRRAIELADELIGHDDRKLELRYAEAAAAIVPHLELADAEALAARIAGLEEEPRTATPSFWRTAWARRLYREGLRERAFEVVTGIVDDRFRVSGAAVLLDEADNDRDRLRLTGVLVAAVRSPDARGADLHGAARRVKPALRAAGAATRARMLARLGAAPGLLAAVTRPEERDHPLGTIVAVRDDGVAAVAHAAIDAVGHRLGLDRPPRAGREEAESLRPALAALGGGPAPRPAARGLGRRDESASAGEERWSLGVVDRGWDWSGLDDPRGGELVPPGDVSDLRAELAAALREPVARGVGVGESLWGVSMDEVGRRQIDRTSPRARAQADVVHRMAAAGAAGEALAALNEIDHDFWRGLVLARIAPLLPTARLGDALEAARRLPPMYGGLGSDGDSRTAALHVIARVLAARGRVNEGSAVTDELPHAPARRATRAAIAPALAALPRAQLAAAWQATLVAQAGAPRVELVRELALLAPVLEALAGPSALRDLAGRIERLAAWWPLAPIVG